MSAHHTVLYTAEARNDLRSIYAYIAFKIREKESAKRQTDRIRVRVRALADSPDRHAAVDWEPWASMGMRVMPVDNYLVYYLVEDQRVIIVRIFYGGRDVEGIVRRHESDYET